MPVESRFRLVRPFDIAEAFAQRRSGAVGILVDEPARHMTTAVVTPATQRTLGIWARGGGGVAAPPSSFRTPRTTVGRGRASFGMTSLSGENTPPVGDSSRRRGLGSNSVLPSWYPRTPLRDITAITRAIERRRARLGEVNGEIPEGQVLSPQFQDAPPEHEVTTATPSTIKRRPCPTPSVLKVHKILLEVANQPDEGEFVTPQKKLLNSIDKVEKVVLEELQRLKRTPSAKKAERERKVRTLMSMR